MHVHPGGKIRGSRGSQTVGWTQQLRDSILVGSDAMAGHHCRGWFMRRRCFVFGAIRGVADLQWRTAAFPGGSSESKSPPSLCLELISPDYPRRSGAVLVPLEHDVDKSRRLLQKHCTASMMGDIGYGVQAERFSHAYRV